MAGLLKNMQVVVVSYGLQGNRCNCLGTLSQLCKGKS